MKTSIKRKREQGFSIIEVLIVLAIAGLLMAVIFIAVPQLQRNARDNARQNLVNRLKSEMETYSSNNQGKYPLSTAACGATDSGKWCDFFTRYVSGKIDVQDPSTGSNVITATPGTSGSATASYVAPYAAGIALPANAGVMGIITGAKCDGEGVAASGTASATTKNFAVVMGLDRAGTRYCLDNG